MNKDILYSTENSIQYLKITYNGKEFLKRIYIHIHIHIYIYMYIKKPNHFVVHLKLTQYCKSTILQLKKKNVYLACGCLFESRKVRIFHPALDLKTYTHSL